MKRKEPIRLLLCCVATALLTALALGAILYGQLGGEEGVALFRKIRAVDALLTEEYVGETHASALADGAAAGMVAAIDDRWSYYMTAQEYLQYQQRSANQSQGIGITVGQDEENGGFLIVSVAVGSPAESAGVQAGEVLISAAGEALRGKSIEELRALILGQEGVFLLGLRGSDGRERSVSVQAGYFYSNPVSYRMLDSNNGYIAIANFEEGAAEETRKAVEELRGQGADALIFDVRNNPGGKLNELIELLDYLLPEGDLFISVDKDGEEKIYRSQRECVELPMAVLINANSYSAAEFFAAALREYDKAVLVGEASTGKGRSQMTYELFDGSAVHISTRRYLTPGRVDLAEEGGLRPDIEQPATQDDAQLAAATKYLS